MRVLATLRRGRALLLLEDRVAATRPAPKNRGNEADDGSGTQVAGAGPDAAVSTAAPPPTDHTLRTRAAANPLPKRWRWEEAEHYLRHWRGDGAAMHQLRGALQHLTHGMHMLPVGDEQVLRALAAHLCAGTLSFREEAPMAPLPATMRPPAPAAAEAPAVAAPRGPIAMVPGALSALPILPLLEEVQIEGADVLPEIMQSLEQVDLTLENLDLASVSLDPTPSRIPQIQTALGDATGAVNGVLDAL